MVRYITRVTTAAFVALAGILPASAQNQQPEPQLTLEPCFIPNFRERISCAELEVPLDYGDPDGVKISIHAAVIPATSSQPQPDPFVIFAGGPGQAAGEFGSFVNMAFHEIRKNRDILLVDQRGTGKSHALACRFESLEDQLVEPKLAAEKCLKQQDVDVRHFTLEHLVKDIDAVREGLGYEQLNLWGGSYGTKSSSHYLKRYPEHVRSIIVDGVLPADNSLFLSAPASAEAAFAALVDDCNAQPSCLATFPNFREQVEKLIQKAADNELPFKGIDPLSGTFVEFDIQYEMAVEAVRSSLYNPDAAVMVPYIIQEADKGNLMPLMASLSNASAMTSSMYIGATLSLLCGEDVAVITPEQAKAAAEGSFAGDHYYRIWSSYCSGWDYLVPDSPDFFDAVISDVPALALSGSLDPVTPPSLAEHWLKGFENGRHIVVPGTGHNTSYVACMPELMAEFVETLDASALDARCFEDRKRLPLMVDVNGRVE